MHRALHTFTKQSATPSACLTSRRVPFAIAAIASAAAAVLAGCGNQYRPVVSAINPVGPASQPTKYAIGVSNPNQTVDQITGYSVTGNIITVTLKAANPFKVGQTVTLSGFGPSAFLNNQRLQVLSITGTQFTAVLAHANATGTEIGFATIAGTTAGLVTFVDFSGDTVLSTPNILPNPSYFNLNNTGTEGFVINAEGVLNDFATANPTALLTSNIVQTTLPAASSPYSVTAITPANNLASIFVPQTATSSVAVLNVASTALTQQLAVGANPVYVFGADSTPRLYSISQNAAGANGQVAAIEGTSTLSLGISATIPVGIQPVYGVMTADTRRAFVMNKGSGTVSVLNVVDNALDLTVPTITMPNVSYNGGSYPPNPVWADFSPATNELVVLNQGDGVHPGSLAIINIPLCSTITQPIGNGVTCSSTDPSDAVGFGTFASTPVNVGINPQMVSVLRDGTAAYVANELDSTGLCAAGEGSISVVSLTSGVVTATICGVSSAAATVGANTTPGFIYGHPTTIAATQGTPTGKVYVSSPDSQYMSIIYTDSNTVQQHINLQGLGLRVLMTTPNVQ